MPIVDPLRLKSQLQQCLSLRNNPTRFVYALLELLESYSDRSYRPGTTVTSLSPIKSFHVPPALLRAIKKELAELSRSQPGLALTLAQELWAQPFRECKELGIAVLENLPLEMDTELFRIVEQWVSSCNIPDLVAQIAQSALKNLAIHRPASLLEQTQKWLRDEQAAIRKFGFLVLEQVSRLISFRDFPLILKVISPYLKHCPAPHFSDFVVICTNLITKSPKEMAYLMRTTLQENPSADTKKVLKSCLGTFPVELQNDLLTVLKG